jgi:hypothetical protein
MLEAYLVFFADLTVEERKQLLNIIDNGLIIEDEWETI